MSIVQLTDPRLIKQREEKIAELTRSSISINTRINYQADIRRFQKEGYDIPASPKDIIAYLVKFSTILSPSSLERHLRALRFVHKHNNYVDPTDDIKIKQLMKGIKNTYGKPPKRAAPFTLDNLKAIDNYYKITAHEVAYPMGILNTLRDNALIQIGFFGAFRQTEIVNIKFEHIAWKECGIEILLPRSKTDQIGEGQTVAIPHMTGPICPVKTLKGWLEAANITSGFIFPVIYKDKVDTRQHIKPERLYDIIKLAAKGIGLSNWNAYSAHSLRRGFATEAARNGASLLAIKKQGRWVNMDTMLGYIEEGNRFNDNAAHVFDAALKS